MFELRGGVKNLRGAKPIPNKKMGNSPPLYERACFLNTKRRGVCAEEGRMKAERARFPTEREEERGLNRAALTRWGKASVPSRRILRAPSYHEKKMLSQSIVYLVYLTSLITYDRLYSSFKTKTENENIISNKIFNLSIKFYLKWRES